ncbi:MAG: hypothetical protein ACPGXK_16900 [Phycisphaerae bacterium]
MSVLVAVVDWTGYVLPIRLDLYRTPYGCGYVLFSDGLVRIYTFSSEDPVDISFDRDSRRVRFRRISDRLLCLNILHADPARIAHHEIVETAYNDVVRFDQRTGLVMSRLWLNGVRTSGPVLAGAFVLGPALYLYYYLRTRRRYRAGQCRGCGYDLTGNVTGLCSECGSGLRCGACGCDWELPVPVSCPGCGAVVQAPD